jgi:hypothetical protein
MNRRITLSIALVFGVVLVSLMSSVSTVIAQQGGRRSVTDTGMLTLGPNEVLRITVNPRDGAFSGTIVVRFRRLEYAASNCNGGVCKHVVASQTTSDPITLDRGEAASFDIQNVAFGVRGMVLSSNPNVEVRGIVFDTSTQRINAICTFIPD